MFGSVGGMEIILVLVVALLLFGPRKLPQIGRTVGKALSEFRRATTDFKMNLEREVDISELRNAGQEIEKMAGDVKQAVVARGSIRASGPATAGAPSTTAGKDAPGRDASSRDDASSRGDVSSAGDASSSSTPDADPERRDT